MIRAFIIFIGVLLSVSGTGRPLRASVDRNTPQGGTVTLYSQIKYQGERSPCLDLQAKVPSRNGICDVRYGGLYLGDDLDWFESSAEQRNRSVIKDLGLLNWDPAFTVPAVEPFRKLQPGEQREITVDASGADGADGAPGSPGRPGADADGVVRQRMSDNSAPATVVPVARSKPKHDGKPRVDPLYVKVVIGHMYVIHVVDDTRDFYALFRVEALERGDYCTVSWRLVPVPDASAKTEMTNR